MKKKIGLFTGCRKAFALAVVFAFAFTCIGCSQSPSGNGTANKSIQNSDLSKLGEATSTDSIIPPKSIDTTISLGAEGVGLSKSGEKTKTTISPGNIVPKAKEAKVSTQGNDKIPANPGKAKILIKDTKSEISTKPLDVVIPPQQKTEVPSKSIVVETETNPPKNVSPKSVDVVKPKGESASKSVDVGIVPKPESEKPTKSAVVEKEGKPNKNISTQPPGWVAPESANKLVNPLKGNSSATGAGKKLFGQFCAICHGKKGKGDGVAGMSLKPRPSNFTQDAVQMQTDGAIFWKLSEGKPPMAPYKSALTEEQRWQLVNYIRSFKKK